MILNLKVFFFDAKRDYLPYYKTFNIDIDTNSSLNTLLSKIKERDRDFDYPKERAYLRLNSLVTSSSVSVKKLVDKLGSNLTIEPISKYRCVNDLIINDSNFYENLKKLEKFCSQEDIEYYNRLYGVFYASGTFEYNKEYIGDAALILASRLIYNKHPKRDEILDIISQDNGLWDAEWENNLFEEIDYKSTFELLKKLAKPKKDINRVNGLFVRKYKDINIKNDEQIGIAFYYGEESKELWELSSGAINKGYVNINYSHANKSCGVNLLTTNEELALKKAARVLLDAYDSGATLLLCDKIYSDYFRKNIGKIERISRRNILMNIQDINEFSID